MMHFQNSITLMMAMKASLKIVLTLAALMCAASALAMTTVRVGRPGTLGSVLTPAQMDTCSALAIKGKLNSADIKVLRRMAGWSEGGQSRVGRLTLLDLSKAKIESSYEPYLVLDAADECLVCAAYAKQVRMRSYGITRHEEIREVQKYAPAYALNYRSDEKYAVVRPAYLMRETNVVSPLPPSRKGMFEGQASRHGIIELEGHVTLVSKDEFVFRRGVSDAEWLKLTRAGLHKFPGHELKKDGERYKLYCSTKKNVFSADFFYKCPHLKMVMLSKKVSLDESIIVCDDAVCYGNKMKVLP